MGAPVRRRYNRVTRSILENCATSIGSYGAQGTLAAVRLLLLRRAATEPLPDARTFLANIPMLSQFLRPMLALLVLHPLSPSLAGPPLSIDDPGILEPLQLELITAATLTSSDVRDYYQVPLLDVSMGLIQDYVQFSVVYPYIHSNPDDGSSASEFGNLEVGVKWRFLNNDRLQMAFAPSYAFGVTRRAAAQGIGDETDYAVFPVNAEYRLNDLWQVNGEVRYVSVDAGGDEWDYGVGAAYALDERWKFLFELSGTADNDLGNHFLDARVGFDAVVTESIHVLFSIATGLREPSGADKLDVDVFIGIQYFR